MYCLVVVLWHSGGMFEFCSSGVVLESSFRFLFSWCCLIEMFSTELAFDFVFRWVCAGYQWSLMCALLMFFAGVG